MTFQLFRHRLYQPAADASITLFTKSDADQTLISDLVALSTGQPRTMNGSELSSLRAALPELKNLDLVKTVSEQLLQVVVRDAEFGVIRTIEKKEDLLQF